MSTFCVGAMYAVVDIETTGGHASASCITEIAIIILDGQEVVESYETLINPQRPIPFFIQKLTGITPEMVAEAPVFEEVARTIFDLLQGNIFVAHNVNFDYSFVKYQLAEAGYELNCKKLCTIRAAKKVLPGLQAYGLSKLTLHLGIEHTHKHRAGGDAKATAQLLKFLLVNDHDMQIPRMLHGRGYDQYLPPHVLNDEVEMLPNAPGVYYFHDSRGQVIYIGKAVNLRKRVKSHFSNDKTGKTKQDLLREVKHISFQTCGADLVASVLESAEIRAKWPLYNRSQRGFQPVYGLMKYQDRAGKFRLFVARLRKGGDAIYNFNTLVEGKQLMRDVMREFSICPTALDLCAVNTCQHFFDSPCEKACCAEVVDVHNQRMQEALQWIHKRLPTFVYLDNGRSGDERSFIVVKLGTVKGIGFVTAPVEGYGLACFEGIMNPILGNDFMRNLVYKSATRWPEKTLHF